MCPVKQTCVRTAPQHWFFFNKFLSKTALDWGTNADHRTQSNEFFRVYYAAFDAYQRRDANHDSQDVTHILKYVENITNESLQSNPIFLRKDLQRCVTLREDY